MQEYLQLDKLRTLFNIDDHIYKLYNTLKMSMIIPNEQYFTILYLCPNSKEVQNAYKCSIKRCNELEYLSDHKSKIISKDIQRNIIYFYNSFKNRQEKILIFPLKKIESGFDGYRISQIMFFGLDGKESTYENIKK